MGMLEKREMVATLRNEVDSKLDLLRVTEGKETFYQLHHMSESLGARTISLARYELVDLIRNGLTELGVDSQLFEPVLGRLSRANVVR